MQLREDGEGNKRHKKKKKKKIYDYHILRIHT